MSSCIQSLRGRALFAAAIASAALALAIALTGQAETASAHGMCKNVYGGDVVWAHDLSCRKARRIVRTWAKRYKNDDIIDRSVLGFNCRGNDDQYEGLTMRCRRGERFVRFYANVP